MENACILYVFYGLIYFCGHNHWIADLICVLMLQPHACAAVSSAIHTWPRQCWEWMAPWVAMCQCLKDRVLLGWTKCTWCACFLLHPLFCDWIDRGRLIWAGCDTAKRCLPSFTSNTLANGVTAMSDGRQSVVAACRDKLSDISWPRWSLQDL